VLVYPNIERVCIFGTGGVGGYYGGKIAEVFQHERDKKREIYFIARGEHLQAIQQNGIQVKTPERIIQSKLAKATSHFNEIPQPDLIFLCTKSYDLKIAVESLKENIRENTVIIPLLNGVDIYQRIRSILQTAIVLPACVYLGTHIEKPGVIAQNGGSGIILSGKDPGFPLYTAENLQQFFSETGIGFSYSADPYPDIWEKCIFIASFGLVTACYGKTLGEVMENGELSAELHGIIHEIISIAEKKTVRQPAQIEKRTLTKAASFPRETRTSYQRDVELWPKPNEGDLFGGAILREGSLLGVPTPVTKAVYSRILHR
jgi:2-dehydropantoate 2-reductase